VDVKDGVPVTTDDVVLAGKYLDKKGISRDVVRGWGGRGVTPPTATMSQFQLN
jgi:hypothetical protein